MYMYMYVLINSKLLILAISCVLQISFYMGISKKKKNQDGGIQCQHVKSVHDVKKGAWN